MTRLLILTIWLSPASAVKSASIDRPQGENLDSSVIHSIPPLPLSLISSFLVNYTAADNWIQTSKALCCSLAGWFTLNSYGGNETPVIHRYHLLFKRRISNAYKNLNSSCVVRLFPCNRVFCLNGSRKFNLFVKSDLKMEKKIVFRSKCKYWFIFIWTHKAFLYTLCNVYRKIRSYIKFKKLKANPHVI